MKLSYSQRILMFLAEQERTNGNAVFNMQVAKRRFRNVGDIDGSVMRRARELASSKMLKRTPDGFTLTARGRKEAVK